MTRQHLLQQRIEEAIGQYAMLRHPFYQLWNEGKLSATTLAEYARQYYAHVCAFPTYVSAVHSRCDSLPVRQLLLENLIEEERGADNHPELWLRFAEGLGVSRDQVRSARLLPSTRESVESLKSLTANTDYRLGVAALYAYESQIPEVAKTKRVGLKQVRDKAVAAAQQGAKALWDFLSGVQEAYVLRLSCEGWSQGTFSPIESVFPKPALLFGTIVFQPRTIPISDVTFAIRTGYRFDKNL